MTENSAKNIRNGVIASVIAGIILMLIPIVRSYAAELLSWAWSNISGLWSALWVGHLVSGWLILLISGMAIVGLLAIFISLREVFGKRAFHSYTEDVTYGAVWRWGWASDRISNLWCFCPRCDATLVYDDSTCRNHFVNASRTDFICENCGHSVIASITGGNKAYALSAIEREIHRKIRTGEHPEH